MIETSSAGGIVVNMEGKILVVNQQGSSWSLPKGHIEMEEDALAAAKREINEESGLVDLRYIKELGSYQRFKMGQTGTEPDAELKTITMFLFETNQESLKPIDPENPEARWVSREEVEKILTHVADKSFFKSVIDQIDPS